MAKFCFLLTVLCLGVFRSSQSEDVASQPTNGDLASLSLNHLSKQQLTNLVNELLNKSPKDGSTGSTSCSDQFTLENDVIIRTRDSLSNGAKFLGAISDVESAKKCNEKCCSFVNDSDHDIRCDVSVYQGPGDTRKEPQCFLFDCVNESQGSEFLCLFSQRKGYIVHKRNQLSTDEKELEAVAEKIPRLEVTSPKTTTTSTEAITQPPPTTTTTTIPATTTTISTTTTIATTTSAHLTTKLAPSICEKSCGKFDWKCDNDCCVSIFKVCDKMAQCDDGSDEENCPASDNDRQETDTKSEGQSSQSAPSPTTTKTTATVKTTAKTTTKTKTTQKPAPTSTPLLVVKEVVEHVEVVHPEKGALLPLALGLAVTFCVLVMVACRLRVMKKKISKRRPLLMDESDYLINGMYL